MGGETPELPFAVPPLPLGTGFSRRVHSHANADESVKAPNASSSTFSPRSHALSSPRQTLAYVQSLQQKMDVPDANISSMSSQLRRSTIDRQLKDQVEQQGFPHVTASFTSSVASFQSSSSPEITHSWLSKNGNEGISSSPIRSSISSRSGSLQSSRRRSKISDTSSSSIDLGGDEAVSSISSLHSSIGSHSSHLNPRRPHVPRMEDLDIKSADESQPLSPTSADTPRSILKPRGSTPPRNSRERARTPTQNIFESPRPPRSTLVSGSSLDRNRPHPARLHEMSQSVASMRKLLSGGKDSSEKQMSPRKVCILSLLSLCSHAFLHSLSHELPLVPFFFFSVNRIHECFRLENEVVWGDSNSLLNLFEHLFIFFILR